MYFLAYYRDPAADVLSPLATLLKRFKYDGDRRAGHALASIVRRHAYLAPCGYDLIVPVPPHLASRHARPFHHSAWLARAVSHRIATPMAATLLRWRSERPPQVGRGSQARRQMTQQAIESAMPRLGARRVLLVDDVVTTGATVETAASALARAGAAWVDAFALLRSDCRISGHVPS